MTKWFNITGVPTFAELIEIIILAMLCYYVLALFRGRRAAPILTGFVLAVVLSLSITRILRLDTLAWLFGRFSVYLAVAVLVIFQPEIRQALAELGKQHFFSGARPKHTLIDQLAEAAAFLASKKIGALIAVEQTVGLKAVQGTGTLIDAKVSPELICSIFFPYTPLHDGAVIINEDRIVAAGCMLPIADREDLAQSLGARHRAAIGLSDETDAVILVVSEETGAISICHKGILRSNLAGDNLRLTLAQLMIKSRKNAEAKDGIGKRIATLVKSKLDRSVHA